MISVTRLNNSQFWVNPDLIQFIEETPDTVITLTNDVKVVVTEPAAKLIEAIVEFRRLYYGQLPRIKERDTKEE